MKGIHRLLTEGFEKHLLESFQRSWFNADREERRARRRAVMQLSLELEKIKIVSAFATGIGEGVVDDVIEGDWRRVGESADHFEFKEESEDLRARYAPIWADFVTIARAACAQARERAAGNMPARN